MLYMAFDVKYLLRVAKEDLQSVPAQLILKSDKAFDRWDRFRSEAEWRYAITWPLAALGTAAGLSHRVPLVLATSIGLGAALMLAWQGYVQSAEADRQLVASVVAGAADLKKVRSIPIGDYRKHAAPPSPDNTSDGESPNVSAENTGPLRGAKEHGVQVPS